MGLFLSLSGVIGRTKDEVLTSLTNYVNSVDGGLSEENLTTDNEHCCVIEEINGNTTILYPNGYIEWDASSEFISKELMTSVFSFHIHDGDLWMYILYANGIVIDQFNPIPDYWTDEISEIEIQSWKGDASIITKQIPNLESKDIEKYLVRWDFDNEDEEKAYPNDEFIKEDWQLVDFMRKVGFSYPLNDNGNVKGQTFKLWTKELRLKPEPKNIIARDNLEIKDIPNNIATVDKPKHTDRPWWKFW